MQLFVKYCLVYCEAFYFLYYVMSSTFAEGAFASRRAVRSDFLRGTWRLYVGKNSAADNPGKHQLRFLLYDFIQKLLGWVTEALSGGSGIN
jgi:hypothetical protein